MSNNRVINITRETGGQKEKRKTKLENNVEDWMVVASMWRV